MRKIFYFFLLFTGYIQAQELNCAVQINTQTLTNANQPIFKTLERSLTEFVNNTKWTNKPFKQNEKIDCSMVINVTAYGSDQFVATIQVSSSRPIYDSTYSSPVFNFNDKDFNFRYVEYENLIYNPNSYDSNLVSVMAFYSYLIIGMDADTFSPLGGSDYFRTAQEIGSLAQQGNFKGWSQADGNQTRFMLTNELLSGTFEAIRTTMYDYHSKGLDVMSQDVKKGKEKVKEAINSLSKVYSVRPNAFLTRTFFDAKSDEIQSIFSGGPQIAIADLVDNLNKFSPINSSKWASIKF
ncbi:type IX secretion system protein PorD [Flavobacterium soli]|uniref:type IX secretion system protein PorD n=1 Tax=Flavobacterium soli TaxID=344881 RepID=UPI0004162BD0|nr:DUF4835 family protein [Flavobacterium soli]